MSQMFRSFEANSGTIQRKRGMFKKAIQQGRRGFGARSVHGVRAHAKSPRTQLGAFFYIPRYRSIALAKSSAPAVDPSNLRQAPGFKRPPSCENLLKVIGSFPNPKSRLSSTNQSLLDITSRALLAWKGCGALLKKSASDVLGPLSCSRTPCTLRSPTGLWPCWTAFFNSALY